MGFSRQGYWSGLPFPSSGDLPHQGLNPGLPHCRQILYSVSHHVSDQFWGDFSHSFFLFSLSFLLGLQQCARWSTWWFPTCPLGFVHFSLTFFLFQGLHNFHCPILKLADSLFCLLKSVFILFWLIFHFSCSFQLSIFFPNPSFVFSLLIFPFYPYITVLTFSTSS